MVNQMFKDMQNKWIADERKRNSTFGNFAGGEDAFNFIMQRIKNGIDPKQRAMIEGQASGQIAGGTQALNEAFAGSGLSQGSKLAAQTALRSNVGKNTQQTLLQGDENAKMGGLNALFQGAGLNHNIMNDNRNFNLQQKAYQDSQDFDWGDLFGGLLGTGGSIFGKFLGL